MKISMNILNDKLDSEECVNDTFMQAWKIIPPHRPSTLNAFLGKITRNLAINKYKACHTKKRALGEFAVSLDELDDCIASHTSIENELEVAAISKSISDFLRKQPDRERRIFVCRYFYCDSISEIAALYKASESKIKSILFRTRNKLKQHLKEGGITI